MRVTSKGKWLAPTVYCPLQLGRKGCRMLLCQQARRECCGICVAACGAVSCVELAAVYGVFRVVSVVFQSDFRPANKQRYGILGALDTIWYFRPRRYHMLVERALFLDLLDF